MAALGDWHKKLSPAIWAEVRQASCGNALNPRNDLLWFPGLHNEAVTITMKCVIRPICLSRETGTAAFDDTGTRWFAAASLVDTNTMTDIGPLRYFDLLTRRLPDGPITASTKSYPDAWSQRLR